MELTGYRIPVDAEFSNRQCLSVAKIFSVVYFGLGLLTIFLNHVQPDHKAEEAIPIIFISWPFVSVGMFYFVKFRYRNNGIDVFENGFVVINFLHKFESIEPNEKLKKIAYCSSEKDLWNLHNPNTDSQVCKVPKLAFPNLEEQLSSFSKC